MDRCLADSALRSARGIWGDAGIGDVIVIAVVDVPRRLVLLPRKTMTVGCSEMTVIA